jgi:hypothetical protein
MSKNTQLEISKLNLDLKNYRTTPQKTEIDAIKAMISIKPDKFFSLLESILNDGYLQTENIIVLDINNVNIVKEGNRRIACLKLIHQIYKLDDIGIPEDKIIHIKSLSKDWLNDNLKVSCVIYDQTESAKAEKIVSLTHAKGESAGRDKWTSVATARHNRDENKKPEIALDLLEKYLIEGKNLTAQQKERWAGDYNLTVLVEAISKIHTRLGFTISSDLVNSYPKLKQKIELEDLMRDIGLGLLGFPNIRNPNEDFALSYGINPIVVQTPIPVAVPNPTTNPITSQPVVNNPVSTTNNPTQPIQPTINVPQSVTPIATPVPLPPKAVASNDPKHVTKLLKTFNPRGPNRSKVVVLKNELLKLKIVDNPIAFCFILRSMFEISAKAYFGDHSLSFTKSNGKEKTLVEILTEVKTHLTTNNTNIAKVKILHGAMLNITTPDKILSVTSMNHLVHNPNFSIIPSDICTLFGNIFPLLEEMN